MKTDKAISVKITLVENEAISTNEIKISKTMNNFYINTAKKIKLKPCSNSSNADMNQITSVFKDQVSINKIQKCFSNIRANYLV